MKKYILPAFTCMLCLSNCNTSKKPVAESAEKSIAGINWYLKKVYLPSGNLDINSTNAFIRFDAAKNSAGGKGGCNSFGSNYTIQNNSSLSFKNVFSTKMFCEQFQLQEDAFFKQLEKANRYEVKEGKLLMYADNDLLLEFGK